jgi:hypothetical protein
MDNNNIIIYFEKEVIKNLKLLKFEINQELKYINNSHVNYIYDIELNNKLYIFHGLYKDGYFLIITEIYDNILKNTIYDKNIILIKIKWLKKNIDKKINLYFLEIEKDKYEYIFAPLRKELFNTNDLSIDDLLLINNYNTDICKIENNVKINLNLVENEKDISSSSKNIIKKISKKLLNVLL